MRSPRPSITPASDADAETDAFCRLHWPRLHRLACHRGCDPQTAQDVVQDLFTRLIRHGDLTRLVREPLAIQNTHLSQRLRCLLINRWRDAHRQRRGGEIIWVSMDSETAHFSEPATHDTPAAQHDRVWLAQCISTAVSRLQTQTTSSAWQHIRPVLLEETDTAAGFPSAQTNAQRTALCRARQKLRHLVREEMNGSFQEWAGLTRPQK